MIALVQNLKRLVAVVWGLLENFRFQWLIIRDQHFKINSQRIAEFSFKGHPTFRSCPRRRLFQHARTFYRNHRIGMIFSECSFAAARS